MKMKLFSYLMALCAYQSNLSAIPHELDEFYLHTYDAYVNVGGSSSGSQKIVTNTKKIVLPGFPAAHNPSIIEFGDGYLMTFRNLPLPHAQCWVSDIGVVLLNKSFDPVSQPQLLNTRFLDKRTPSQSEDARIVSANGKLYLIYNDNMEVTHTSTWHRRDMYIAELIYSNQQFSLSTPVKLFHPIKYPHILWQKNWNPFVWNNTLLLSYSLNPHEVLLPDLNTGLCNPVYETGKAISWNLGPLRGSGQALLVDGEYLAFFHSGIITDSPVGGNMWHYFMGAYTFSAEPPFGLTKVSAAPIDAPGFYLYSNFNKRVVYPGGFVRKGSTIYVAYGKDDSEAWIATIDLNNLKKSLVPAY
jgi:predicted GH43/DUF377 family glycosyl hydrolase